MIGTLDEQSRLARVLIIVPDPLGRETDAPPLILGTLIETEIEGKPIDDVVRLRRDYVRERDTVWVMKEGKLEIREAEVIYRDAEYAYVGDGLDHGDEVVTTTLATVAEGVGLRKASDASESRPSRGRTARGRRVERSARTTRVESGTDRLDGPELDRGQPVDVPSARRGRCGRRSRFRKKSSRSSSSTSWKSPSAIRGPRPRKWSKEF